MSQPEFSSLGSYQIVSEIGRGGMAVVYKAYQPNLNRHVAIKVLASHLAQDATFVARFRREAQIAAGLKHPSIIEIYEVSEAPPYFIVMRLIEGESITALVQREHALAPARAVAITEQIASALDYAHRRGVVHRDIKSSNIMVDALGNATLTDFGIAKAVEGSRLTQTGGFMGTPEYVAPEQIQGKTVDGRADIYALGIVCYEMLTGFTPFRGDTVRVLYAQVHETPPPLRSLAGNLPAAFEKPLARTLAKDPEKRYEHASEFATALGAITARLKPTEERKTKPETKTETGTRLIEAPAQPLPQPSRTKSRVPVLAGIFVAVVILFVVVALAFNGTITRIANTPKTETATSVTSLVNVPVLVGQPVSRARAMLEQSGLRIEKQDQRSIGCSDNDTVLSQDPAMGRSVNAGSTVRVVVCAGPTVTPPLPPTPLPTSEVVRGSFVIARDSFDDASLPGWRRDPNVSIQNGVAQIVGNNTDSKGIWRQRTLTTDQGFVVQFRFTTRSRFDIDIETGQWQTATFRRWGMFGTPEYTFAANVYQGTQTLNVDWAPINVFPSPNQWYYLMLRIGGAKDSVVRIWDATDPSKYTEMRKAMGVDWAYKQWSLVIRVNQGTLEVDNYQEMNFPPQ